MSRAIQGIDYTHARTRAESGEFYGLPSEVSLEPGYEATSEVYVIDDLTFFKGLSGDEASSIIINSWLFTTLATTPIKFIKSTGLIHN